MALFSRAFMGYTIARHRLRNAAAQAATSGTSGGQQSRQHSSDHQQNDENRSHKSRMLRSTPLFTCSLGVSFAPKRRRKQPGVTGEDAFFYNLVRSSPSAAVMWIGVLDGVGGWADQGVDPSIFARRLAHHLDTVSAARPVADSDPRSALDDAYEKLLQDDEVKMGSSTACVASITMPSQDGPGEVRVANLGDSGYLIVSSSGEILAESIPQTYFFNAPYQLAKMPASMKKKGSLQNKPADADLTRHAVGGDQYLILATDGYFDNVHTSTTASVVAHACQNGIASTASMLSSECEKHSQELKAEVSVQLDQLRRRLAGNANADAILRQASDELVVEDGRKSWETALAAVNTSAVDGDREATDIARLLTALAVRSGRDPHAQTPFAQEARKHNLRFRGGKEDDVVVIVVKLSNRPASDDHTSSVMAKGRARL